MCQLRSGNGQTIFLFFADLASAFDTVSHDDIRRALFEADIVGKMWLLLDDLLASDLATVNINGVSSGHFKLYAGTAQGRELSAHLLIASCATCTTALRVGHRVLWCRVVLAQ